MPAVHARFAVEADHLAQAAADAIALDGVADLARHREADADRACVAARTHLEYESGGRNLGPGRRFEKVRPLLLSFHLKQRRGYEGRWLGAEPLASAGAASLDHLASAGGRHA